MNKQTYESFKYLINVEKDSFSINGMIPFFMNWKSIFKSNQPSHTCARTSNISLTLQIFFDQKYRNIDFPQYLNNEAISDKKEEKKS